MSVLIVDDSKAMRMLVQRAMKQAGYGNHEYQDACNGREALELIQQDTPNLVICDWNMPEMNGIELLTALRESGIDVNFGFVTSEATTEMCSLAEEAGASFFVTKPFTAEMVGEAVRDLL